MSPLTQSAVPSCLRLWWRLALLLCLSALGVGLAKGASQRASGIATFDQTTTAEWEKVYFPTAFSAPPVVVAGPASFNNSQPTTVRVRNVTKISFEMQLDEWDYLDGTHPAETVSWLALEPGVHTIGGLTWEAGRLATVNRTPTVVTPAGPFSVAPVILTQVETVANAKALSVRISSASASSFALRIASQEAYTGTLSNESVGYIAIQPGSGTVDGRNYTAVNVTGVTEAWKSITLPAGLENAAFYAATQSFNNADTIALRWRKTVPTGLVSEFFLEEETSLDAELAHAAETVGYLALAKYPNEAAAKLEFGSVDITQTSGSQWQTLTFDQTYVNPVVVFGPVSDNDADPVMVRVKNINSTSCQYQLDEWQYQNGAHLQEEVAYIVMEKGVYDIAGVRWIAGQRTGVTGTVGSETYAPAFGAAPTVMAQVVTVNEATATNTRISGVTNTKFDIRLDEEEGQDRVHVGETVHYIAIEKGGGRLATSGLMVEAGATTNDVRHEYRAFNFTQKIASPVLVGSVITRNETDPVTARYAYLWENSVQLKAQEETSADAETDHARETFGYLALSTENDLDADGMPDAWEVANGLNPNDPADAALDPDGDLQTNVAEHRWGTNPNTFTSAGTVSISAISAPAYELEGQRAQLRVTRSGGTVPVSVFYTVSGTAIKPGQTGAEYRIENTAGISQTTSVPIPFGVNTFDIFINPTADVLEEYPETATITLSSKPVYTLGSPTAATATLYDASDLPENSKVFIANLAPPSGVTSGASGVGTMVLNGPKTEARISLTFNGLTSGQTNAYIRYGITGAAGPELRPNLGTGQISNVLWSIAPVTPYSGQQIIDALFQIGGKYTYTNLGTANYPAGELSGIWTLSSGTSVFTPPPAPPAITAVTGSDLTREAARFLSQATFGPTQADIDAMVARINGAPYNGNRIAAYDAWIEEQLAYTPTSIYEHTKAANNREWAARGYDPYTTNGFSTNQNLRYAWWTVSTKARDQLRQRATFAFSEIFVVSNLYGESPGNAWQYGMATFYDMLGAGVTGNFRDLLENISKHPMMGQYLSHLKNQKAIYDTSGNLLVSPDENYAREIMQLFSIGLMKLHPDGSLMLSAGAPQQTYTNTDIENLARVFTGWSFGKCVGTKAAGYPLLDNTNFNLPAHTTTGHLYFQYQWTNPMKNFGPAYHDTAAKTVLGVPIAAGLDGEQDMDAALDILYNHANVGPFMARLLIQRLVTSNPSPGYIYRVAQKFANNGSGVRGDMKVVLKAILLDYEARTLPVALQSDYGKQKEPIVAYIQLQRALDVKSSMLQSDLNAYGYPAAQAANFPSGATLYRHRATTEPPGLGQTPFQSPTVFNWFHPDYNPGGPIGAAGLVAPEMEINTESSTIAAINFYRQITYSTVGQGGDQLYGVTDASLDDMKTFLVPIVAVYDNARTGGQTVAQATATAADYLDVLLMSGGFKARYGTAPAPNPRSIILDGVSSMTMTATIDRVHELVHLLTATPEFLHQK